MNIKHCLGLAFLILMTACSSSTKKAMQKGNIPLETFSEKVTFEKVLGLSIVTVHLEGEAYRFLFDTGAPMIISPQLQSKLKYKQVASNTIRDSNGSSRKQALVRINELKIGNVPFQNITSYVIEMNSNPMIACLDLDGIIGSNLMRHCTWQIDYENKQLTLTNKSLAQSVAEDAMIASFTTNNQYAIYVKLKSDSSILNKIKVDYGSTGSLSLPNKAFAILKERSEFDSIRIRKGYKQSGLYGGTRPYTEQMGLMDLTLGSVELDDFLVSNEGKGLLGTDFLSNHLVTIDWVSRQIGFEKSLPFDEDEWDAYGASFGQNKNGQVVIRSIHKNSTAESLGIEINNVVHQINEFDMSKPDGFCQFILRKRDNRNELTLTYQDSSDERKTVTLTKQKLF